MTIFLFIILLTTLGYAIFMAWLFAGMGKGVFFKGEYLPEVSIVIPFRNEAAHLETLISALARQKYPHHCMEVLLINDHSEDHSAVLTKELSGRFPQLNFQLLTLEQKTGKKNALYMGVREARHDIILQSDADCKPEDNWVKNSVQPFRDPKVAASLGMVRMTGKRVQRIFALEFLSLQASGAALVQRGIPVMANGANLAYRRDVWLRYHPEVKRWASGDDVFFIQQLALKDQRTIHYNFRSCVDTAAPDNMRSFFNQRVRWGSKTPAYPLRSAQYIAYLVAGENSLLVICFFLGLFLSVDYMAIFMALIAIKSIPDYLITHSFAKQSGQQKLMRLFPLAALLYPFYIVVSGTIIVFGSRSQRWKGRPIQSSD